MARYSILSNSRSQTPDGFVDCRIHYDEPPRVIGRRFRALPPKGAGIRGLTAEDVKEVIRYWRVTSVESICAAIDKNEQMQFKLKHS
jgi:hypothetical protein